MTKSKANLQVVIATCIALSQIAGCDTSESSEDRVVLRTTQNQTEVVTVQTDNGARQTVLVDAEGEERVQVRRDAAGEYSSTTDDQEMSSEVWALFGDELQPMHAILHEMGTRLDEIGAAATAGATPHNVPLQVDSAPAAYPPLTIVKSCGTGSSGGRKVGSWLTVHYGYNQPASFSSAQCAAYASSCGANAQVTGYGVAQNQYSSSTGWMTYTGCQFTTAA